MKVIAFLFCIKQIWLLSHLDKLEFRDFKASILPMMEHIIYKAEALRKDKVEDYA